jgi:hypothetical protein
MTGVLAVTAGTDALPSVAFTGDPNTGIYSPGADQVAISTNGTGRLFVDSSGNVGVDVATPTRQIDIATSNTTVGLGYTIRLRANATAAASAIQWTNADASQTNGYIACDTARSIYLAAGSTERMRISVTGTTTFTSNASTAPLIAIIGASEVARIDSSGRLGLGSSSPDALLTVNGIGAFGAGAVTTPSIAATGDLNTGFWFPAADTIAASTAGSERARIDSSGRLLVGTSTARTLFAGYTPQLQIEGTSTSSSAASLIQNTNSIAGPSLFLGKSRGTSIGESTVLVGGDELGNITFNGADGTDIQSIGAIIKAAVDGTPGANDMPGRLVFSTTTSGSSSPTERVRISANGLSTFGSQAASGAALTVTAPAKIYSSTGTYTDTTTAASGTVTHGTIASFNNPAIAATNATVTYTNASTVYIDGAPTNGTNVTITNPYALYVNSGTSFFGGNVNLSSGNEYRINNTKVVGARITGWAAATGTATRTTFATSTVTTAELAERVKALIDDLISHGLIGT